MTENLMKVKEKYHLANILRGRVVSKYVVLLKICSC